MNLIFAAMLMRSSGIVAVLIPSQSQPAPVLDSNEGCRNLGKVVCEDLPEVSRDSLNEHRVEARHMLEQSRRGSMTGICASLGIDSEQLKPEWNRSYGKGKGCVFWEGNLNDIDGRQRGGLPYFCPEGWTRFALDACKNEDFEKKYGNWGIMYHGTRFKSVRSILASGLRGSSGMCFCGPDEVAVYVSPSIEYSGCPRYAGIECNPATGCFAQAVLEYRVNPNAEWKGPKKEKYGPMEETYGATKYGLRIDKNIPNGKMECVFTPDIVGKDGRKYVSKEVMVCTGMDIFHL